MARCVCNNPCTCYFEYDGDRPNTLYTQPFQYGRYSTRKSGSGTSADPYVIEFLDSEEFQVEAGQARISADNSVTSATTGFSAVGFNVIDYETPDEVFLAFDIHFSDGQIFPAFHKFWFVTAEATFVANASNSTGTRRLHVHWRPPANNYGTFRSIYITGTASTGLPGSEDITLSCSGLLPFVDLTEDPLFNGPGGSLILGLQQSSGATMTVRGIKFSLVAI